MLKIRKWLSLHLKGSVTLFTGRSLWVCLLAASLCATMLYVSNHIKMVYIRDNGVTILRHTLKQEPESILHESGIATMAFDVVDFTGFQGKMGVINISRAFPVTLKADGRTTLLRTTEISVRELLQQEGLKLGPQDLINLSPSFYLSPDDVVVIQRVSQSSYREEEEIPFEVVYRDTPLLPKGSVRVLSKGSNGKRVKTFADTTIDGKLHERELVEDRVIKQPVKQQALRGAKAPVSTLDYGVPLDKNGNPVTYKTVYRNQVSTAYNARAGARGASGLRLSAGSVAVRSSQIPYGTKMYIKSADGSFVYGYAVAADTGYGLVEGAIDIDLYYDTYLESCLNGRKMLDVYIL